MTDITEMAGPERPRRPDYASLSNEEITIIIEIFSKMPKVYEGEAVRDGRIVCENLAEKQKDYHKQIFFSLQGRIRRTIGVIDPEMEAALTAASEFISKNIDVNLFNVYEGERSVSLMSIGNIPIIGEDSIKDFEEFARNILSGNHMEYRFKDFTACVLAVYAIRTARLPGPNIIAGYGALWMLAMIYVARVELILSSTWLDDAFTRQKEVTLRGIEKRIEIAEVMQAGITTEMNNQIDAMSELRSFTASIPKLEKVFEEQHEARLRSFEETAGLAAANRLWRNRARWGRAAFAISSTVLVVCLLAVPASAIYFREQIIAFVKTIELTLASDVTDSAIVATASALSRLVIFTAPFGLIVWLIRIIVRFNVRSMLLMDDAQQRLTMLNTYLYLIKQDAAMKQDRGAVLEALFRRPPGHGPDTVEPPNFIDLLKYGQSDSKGAA